MAENSEGTRNNSTQRTLRQRLLDTDEILEVPKDHPLYKEGPFLHFLSNKKKAAPKPEETPPVDGSAVDPTPKKPTGEA
jgi:hypothetical protein